MREGIKMTTKYQLSYMLLAQALATGVCLLFTLIAFWTLLDKHIGKEIYSSICILVNFCVIYSYANKFAMYDKKPYTPMKVSLLKGLLMGVMISASMIIMFIIFKLSWASSDGDTLSNPFALAGNILFLLWSFPYFGIMGMSHGLVTWYSVVIMLIMPPIASFLGYYAACKSFFILEKIYKFSFVQKKDSKPKK